MSRPPGEPHDQAGHSHPAPPPDEGAVDAGAVDFGPVEFAARPYLMTGGRTRSRQEGIALETIVVCSPTAASSTTPQPFERARVLDLLETPQSVAEIAARLNLPFTVVLVLVGDLVADGFLIASQSSAKFRYDIPFLERLICGVAAL